MGLSARVLALQHNQFDDFTYDTRSTSRLDSCCISVETCEGLLQALWDDIIIFSGSWSDHLRDIVRVVKCVGEAGLTVKMSKSEFWKKYLDYLGHRVGCGRMAVPEARVKHMAQYGRPKTKKQLRSFLGSIGYYRQFMPSFAEHLSLLTLSTSLSSPHTVVWTGEMDAAFRHLRKLLCKHVLLMYLLMMMYLYCVLMPLVVAALVHVYIFCGMVWSCLLLFSADNLKALRKDIRLLSWSLLPLWLL